VIPVWFTDTLTTDFSRAAGYTLLWGLEGVVLRQLERGTLVPDVNEAKLRHRLAADDLPVAAIEPGLFQGSPAERAVWMNDLRRLDESIAFCRRIGCERIIVGALPGGSPEEAAPALKMAGDRADKHGVWLAVRNYGEGRDTGRDLASLLALCAGHSVSACWDPAGALEAGEEASDGLEALGPRLAIVVARDLAQGASGDTRKSLGEGVVGWKRIFASLARRGFGGPVALDLLGCRPRDGLREATRLIHMLRDAERG
jgi:sugar phosphate isomerase/epimerase